MYRELRIGLYYENMTSKETQLLYGFFMEEIGKLRSEMQAGFEEINRKFEAVFEILDYMRGKYDDTEFEQASQNRQLDRHDKAIRTLGAHMNKPDILP